MQNIHAEQHQKRINQNGCIRLVFSQLAEVIEQALTEDKMLIYAVGDFGSLTIVAAIVAGEGSVRPWTTLAAIDDLVIPARIATSRRVRALVEWLESGGAIQRRVDAADGRSRPFRASGWLRLRLAALAAALVPAVLGHPGPAGGDALLRLLGEHIVAGVRRGARPPCAFAWLVEARAGYLLALRLVGDARPDADGRLTVALSRKKMARRCGVSRAHLAALLARMEARGWLRRTPTEVVIVDPGFDASCMRLLASHVAALRVALSG